MNYYSLSDTRSDFFLPSIKYGKNNVVQLLLQVYLLENFHTKSAFPTGVLHHLDFIAVADHTL